MFAFVFMCVLCGYVSLCVYCVCWCVSYVLGSVLGYVCVGGVGVCCVSCVLVCLCSCVTCMLV